MDRQHAIEVGQMFDTMTARIKELETNNLGMAQNLASCQGELKKADELNAKLQATLATRETALALYEAAKNTNASVPMPELPPLDSVTEELARRLAPPLQNMQMPKVQDRRPMRANKQERIAQ